MEIADIVVLSDGRTVYFISSGEEPEIHVGEVLEDCLGNKSRITAIGNVTRCFGPKYSFSLMIDGSAERGKITICKDIKS